MSGQNQILCRIEYINAMSSLWRYISDLFILPLYFVPAALVGIRFGKNDTSKSTITKLHQISINFTFIDRITVDFFRVLW